MNFAVLRALATVIHGSILPSDAAARLRNLHAPGWMILGLLTLDPAAMNPELQFDCDGSEDEPQGEC